MSLFKPYNDEGLCSYAAEKHFDLTSEYFDFQVSQMKALVDQLNEEEFEDRAYLFKMVSGLADQFGFRSFVFGERGVPFQDRSLVGIIGLCVNTDDDQTLIGLIQTDTIDGETTFSLYVCGELV